MPSTRTDVSALSSASPNVAAVLADGSSYVMGGITMRSKVIAAFAFQVFAALAVAQQSPMAASSCPASDATAPISAVQGKDFVELQRTACCGTCPIYTVRLYADGKLIWHGEKFVSLIGEATGRITAEEATAILQNARKEGFWSLCAGYTVGVTDQPTTLTSLSIDSDVKKVSEYGHTAPPSLHALGVQIDTITDRLGWREKTHAP